EHPQGGERPRRRGGRPDRKSDPAADDDEGHPKGDDRHDRGLNQNVGEVERRQKARRQQRCHETKNNQCDQRDLAGQAPAPYGYRRCPFHAPIAARSFGSSARSSRATMLPYRTARTASQSRASSARSLDAINAPPPPSMKSPI